MVSHILSLSLSVDDCLVIDRATINDVRAWLALRLYWMAYCSISGQAVNPK